MEEQQLTVREIQQSDVALISKYWLTAVPEYLVAMGVDLNKIPSKEELVAMLTEQLQLSYEQKKSYCIIWELNRQPIGHSNVNKIVFGKEAYIHLHIWYAAERKMGLGSRFIEMSLPWFFKNLQIKKICCEPYALNPAPNKVLAHAGFNFIKEYITTPGTFNFEQPVNHWEMLAASLK